MQGTCAAIRGADRPSPKGRQGRAIARSSRRSRRSRSTAATIRSGSVPTSFIDPVASPSGRSVLSRRTSSGTPSAGASSCIPPESLSTRSAARIASIVAAWDSGGISEIPRLPPNRPVIRSVTLGLGGSSTSAVDLLFDKLEQRLGQPVEPGPPIFAPMAGHQQAELPPRQPAPARPRRQGPDQRGQRVDAAVAGDVNPPGQLSRRRLAALPLVGANNRSARRSIATRFSSSGQGMVGIVGAKARLDMGQRDADFARGQRAAKGARRVALDDQQVGRIERQQPAQRGADQFGVEHRIGLAGAAERSGWKPVEAMIGQLQARDADR